MKLQTDADLRDVSIALYDAAGALDCRGHCDQAADGLRPA